MPKKSSKNKTKSSTSPVLSSGFYLSIIGAVISGGGALGALTIAIPLLISGSMLPLGLFLLMTCSALSLGLFFFAKNINNYFKKDENVQANESSTLDSENENEIEIESEHSETNLNKLVQETSPSTQESQEILLLEPPIADDLEEKKEETTSADKSIIVFSTQDESTPSPILTDDAAKLIFFSSKQPKLQRSTLELKPEIYPEDVIPKFHQKIIIDDTKYKKYSNMFENKEEKRVIRLIRDHISRITFDQFLTQLNRCMNQLEKYIELNLHPEQPILLSNDKGHSQEWVNKLVYPRLQPMIGERLQVAEIAHPPQRQEQLVTQMFKQLRETGVTSHLYLDDCSYSGTQVSKYLQSILIGLEKKCLAEKNKQPTLPKDAKVNLIFVVPYMTLTAAEVINETLKKNQEFMGSSFELNFKLISSGVIGRIKDLSIDEKNKEIFVKSMETNENKTLTITDWKMPDFVSFPLFFMKGHTKRSFHEHTEPTPFLSQDEDYKPYGR